MSTKTKEHINISATAVARATTHFSSQAAFAKALGISRQRVYAWVKGTSAVPPNHARMIEQLTGVPKEQIRPDIKAW